MAKTLLYWHFSRSIRKAWDIRNVNKLWLFACAHKFGIQGNASSTEFYSNSALVLNILLFDKSFDITQF